MSFLLTCPHCGPRPVEEFSCTGEVTVRPPASADFEALTSYLYFRRNVAGSQREWWAHRLGCEAWFQAERDTRTNEVLRTWVPEPAEASAPEVPPVPDTPPV